MRTFVVKKTVSSRAQRGTFRAPKVPRCARDDTGMYSNSMRSAGNALESLDETIDVFLVVVDMRADPQPTEPRCGIDIFRRELFRQIRRHALRKMQAEHVRRAQLLVDHAHARVGQP